MKVSTKGKYIYLLIVSVITLLGIVLVPTYAKFTDNYITGDDVVGFNFDFDIEISNIEEYEEIEVKPGEMVRFNVDITNSTGELINYGIWYKMSDNSELTEDGSIQIGKLKGSDVSTSGSINNGEAVVVGLGIINSTDNLIKMYVGVGSSNISVNDIEYLNGKKLITGEVNIIRDITINSIKIDGKISDSLPKEGIYTMESSCSRGTILSWDTYSKSITYGVGAKARDICSLEFISNDEYPLLNTMKVGSYVVYTGNGGIVGDTNVKCQVNSDVPDSIDINDKEALNSCMGENVNQYLDDSNYTFGYSGSEKYKYTTTGFRIAYIKDNKVKLISAGSPEVVYRPLNMTDINFIKTLNANSLKYCNNDYVDNGCSCNSTIEGMCDEKSLDVWAVSDEDFYYMTKAMTGIGKRLTISSSNLGEIGGSLGEGLYCYNNLSIKECGYGNDLLDNGSAYWFATNNNDGNIFWNPNGRYVSSSDDAAHYGLRPVINLSADVYVTGGSGTIDDPYTIGR